MPGIPELRDRRRDRLFLPAIAEGAQRNADGGLQGEVLDLPLGHLDPRRGQGRVQVWPRDGAELRDLRRAGASERLSAEEVLLACWRSADLGRTR